MSNIKLQLFTFVMDYCGGTYVSQTEAIDMSSACQSWAESLDFKSIQYLGLKGKENLIEQVAECKPTKLADTINVWFESFTIHGKPAYVNIVQTAK